MRRKIAALAALFIAAVTIVRAEETAKKSGWSTSLALGANLASGNSETKALSGSLISEISTDILDERVGMEGNYGKARVEKEVGGVREVIDNTTAQNAKAYANVKLKFDRDYVYMDDTALYDDLAGIDGELRGRGALDDLVIRPEVLGLGEAVRLDARERFQPLCEQAHPAPIGPASPAISREANPAAPPGDTSSPFPGSAPVVRPAAAGSSTMRLKCWIERQAVNPSSVRSSNE